MQERIGALLGKRLADKPVISTFHAHCVQILRRHIRKLGYPEKFAIYDRGDQESLARSALREIRVPSETLAAWRPDQPDQQLEIALGDTGRRRPRGPHRQGTSGGDGLSPVPAGPEERRGRGFRRPAAVTEELFAKLPDALAGRSRPLRSPAGRRIPGHQRQPVSDRQGAGWPAPQPVRRGRRRSVDLRLARGRSRAHPALHTRLAGRHRGAAGGQLPLDRRNPGTGEPADRVQQDAARQSPAGLARRRREAAKSGSTRTKTPKPSETVDEIRRLLERTRTGSRGTSPSCSAPTSSRGPSKRNCGGPSCPT